MGACYPLQRVLIFFPLFLAVQTQQPQCQYSIYNKLLSIIKYLRVLFILCMWLDV